MRCNEAVSPGAQYHEGEGEEYTNIKDEGFCAASWTCPWLAGMATLWTMCFYPRVNQGSVRWRTETGHDVLEMLIRILKPQWETRYENNRAETS